MVGKEVSWEESGIPNLYRTTVERLVSRRNDYADEVSVVEDTALLKEGEIPRLYMTTLESFGNEIDEYLAGVSEIGTVQERE